MAKNIGQCIICRRMCDLYITKWGYLLDRGSIISLHYELTKLLEVSYELGEG